MIMSGFVVLLIDNIPYACAYGMQGFSFRSVGEPSAEVNELGSREGFTEPLRINMSMVRRRIKSPSLKFDLFPVGRGIFLDSDFESDGDSVNPSQHIFQYFLYRIGHVPGMSCDTGGCV